MQTPNLENHGQYWTKKDNTELTILFNSNFKVEQLAEKFKRTPNAIVSQLERLGLVINRKGFVYKVETKLYYNARKPQ